MRLFFGKTFALVTLGLVLLLGYRQAVADNQDLQAVNFVEIGASLQKGMGGSGAGCTVCDYFFPTNISPGQLIAKWVTEKTGMHVRILLRNEVDSSLGADHISWIREHMPLPDEPTFESRKIHDIIFALDLIMRDFRDLNDLDTAPPDDVVQTKMVVTEALQRMAYNSRLVWIGLPFCRDMANFLNGQTHSCRPAGVQGRNWLKAALAGSDPDYILEPELRSRILTLDFHEIYDRTLFCHRPFKVEFHGVEQLVNHKCLLSRDNFHPSQFGNEVIANVLMQRTSERYREWQSRFRFLTELEIAHCPVLDADLPHTELEPECRD